MPSAPRLLAWEDEYAIEKGMNLIGPGLQVVCA